MSSKSSSSEVEMEFILRGSGEIWGDPGEDPGVDPGEDPGRDPGRDLDRIIAGIGGGSRQGSEREWKKIKSCLGNHMSK